MKAFKARVDEAGSSSGQLPSPDIFGKSLYVFYIGQNDFTGNLASIGISGVQRYLPQVVAQSDAAIKEIYNLGGRSFLVFNIGPIGCYPAFIVGLPHSDSDFDEFGCLASYNNAVVNYNEMLKDKLSETRKSSPNASIVYVDIHSVILDLFRRPKDHGLMYGPKACCGQGGGKYNFNPQVGCGNSKEINGSAVRAEACGDPQNYVSWDGTHTTDAANRLITHAILSGSYSDPPFELNKRCDIQPIG